MTIVQRTRKESRYSRILRNLRANFWKNCSIFTSSGVYFKIESSRERELVRLLHKWKRDGSIFDRGSWIRHHPKNSRVKGLEKRVRSKFESKTLLRRDSQEFCSIIYLRANESVPISTSGFSLRKVIGNRKIPIDLAEIYFSFRDRESRTIVTRAISGRFPVE